MFRSDAMAGTTLGQYLVSLRVATEIDNGMLVAVGALEDGQREVKAMAAITADTKVGAIAVLGSEEVDKETKGSSNPHNLVKATINALAEMRDARMVAQNRGVSMEKVFRG